MKLVSANLTSIKAFLTRLMAGEEFQFDGMAVVYDENHNMYPFRQVINGNSERFTAFDDYHLLEVEVKWYEHLSQPVLCEVYDSGASTKTLDVIIDYVKHDTYPYKGNNDCWEHASPISNTDTILLGNQK